MKKKLNKNYLFKEVESNKLLFWQENNLFKAQANSTKPPFAIVLPPPNVTGHLHIGHAYDFTLPDILMRYKKLQGYDAFIVPGTDHAGIATQTKFEKILKTNEQVDRFVLRRKAFLEKLKIWKDEQTYYIHKQWNALGLGLDYNNYLFTLDEPVVQTVREVFVKMFNENIIYRAKKLVNWDIQLKTAISNIEVIHKEIEQKLYYIKYSSEDQKDFVIVATSRPETMFGDKHLIMNPNDQRYVHLHNKIFINPINNAKMSVILDDYIDIEFGTGVMKCTPAHDFNDYELAKKHNLELINIMNEDGTLNEKCAEFKGLDRLQARALIVDKLQKSNHLVKIENYQSNVGFSERTNEIVEPYLSYQWFIKMDNLVKNTIKMQNDFNDKVDFYPNRFNKTLLTWLENTEDWCISRQLWWGHQIPVWYHKKTNEIYCNTTPPKDLENWIQDEDVLDTWFSSGMWPLLTTKWNSNDQFFKRYFPTALMVTGMDILFFWVSRMMNFSQYLVQKRPFKDVLIHGLIRDAQGKKMSKSLGNGIDPFDIINEYGLDTMRLFFASSTTVGEDLNFSTERLGANWNYLNKIWNIAKYIENLDEINESFSIQDVHEFCDVNKWIIAELSKLSVEMNKNMDKYNLVVATKDLYDFIWNTFASNYLEYTKVLLQDTTFKNETIKTIRYVFNQILIMLHPFAPNISEEIWLNLNQTNESILLQKYPMVNFEFESIIINKIAKIILEIRKLRLQENINNKTNLCFELVSANDEFYNSNIKLINLLLVLVNAKVSEIKKSSVNSCTYELVIDDFILKTWYEKSIDYDTQIKKVSEQLKYLENEIKRATNLLNNQGFVNKAPTELIAKEKDKLNNLEKEQANLLKIFADLKQKVN